MIRYRLKERMLDKGFREKRVIKLNEIIEQTGVARSTLNRILNVHGYSTSTEVLDKLCEYFDCEIQDLVERVRETRERDNAAD